MKNNLLCFAAMVAISAAALPEVNAGEADKNQEAKASASSELKKPVFAGENSIVCGDKTVDVTPDGKIRISADSKALAEISHYCAVDVAETGKTDWGSHSAKLSKVTKEGNKFVWALKRESRGVVWDSGIQTLEILPDGRLKIALKVLPSPAGFKFRSGSQSIWLVLPAAAAEGSKAVYNGKSYQLDLSGRGIPADWKSKEFNYSFYAENPALAFAMTAMKPAIDTMKFLPLPATRSFRVVMEFPRGKSEGEIFIDLRRSPGKTVSRNERGGIDFYGIDRLEMPEARRNLLPNSSFERGMTGYYINRANRDRQWNWKAFSLVKGKAYHGNYALEMQARNIKDYDVRRLQYGVNITTMAIPCAPGKYTVSFTAKSSEKSGSVLNFWVPRFFGGSPYAYFSREGKGSFDLDDEFRRYSATFTVPQSMPVMIHFNVWTTGAKPATVTVDAIQLERGNRMTAYEPKEIEGRLVTAEKDNFLQAGKKIDGRLELFSSRKETRGTARITVKNFFGEILFDKDMPFSTDKDGNGVIPLPLEDIPGKGVFVLKAVYSFGKGDSNYEFHRFAKVDYLDGTHRNRRLFSCDYSDPESSFRYFQFLDRYRKLGIGAKGHHYSFDKAVWDAEKSFGIEPLLAFSMSFVRDKKEKRIGFGMIDAPHRASVGVDDPRLMVRDYKLDSNGIVTPEWLAKLKNAAKTLAKKYPHVGMWTFGGEVSACFPSEWWTKEGTEDRYAYTYARIMKAFSEGIREGNPRAKVTQEDPCNMRPDGGIAEVDRFLYHSNRLGAKYDVISIHPYRYSPESPDLESDTAKLFEVMKKHGYDKTPVCWPEMMHWGPYTVPSWGTDFANWLNPPNSWPGGSLSYDMGRTEMLSASFYARSFLVALRHQDRILTATMGNMRNNFSLDVMLTPYAAQLIPNTLSNILGNARFVEDIRFAPFTRSYVFADELDRPVAAVWCHLPGVDDGRIDAPVVEADFGDSLESVLDLMNSPRNFTKGKFRFPVSGFPLFLRGKAGTLPQMLKALKNTAVISGEGISPLGADVFIASAKSAVVKIENYISKPFAGTIDGIALEIAASGKAERTLPLKKELSDDRLTSQKLDFSISGGGNTYHYASDIYGAVVHRIPENATLKTLDFGKLKAIRIPAKLGAPLTEGVFRAGWNTKALFLEFEITDKTFVHVEYPKPQGRWKNDCIQFYIDTLADGRNRKARLLDENDYSYAIFPNADGRGARFYRYHSVEGQLALGNNTPSGNTFADDIPTEFFIRNGKLFYRTAIPAKYLLPLRLEEGRSFGFGVFVPDSNKPGEYSGGLTTALDGKSANCPMSFPHLVLVGK